MGHPIRHRRARGRIRTSIVAVATALAVCMAPALTPIPEAQAAPPSPGRFLTNNPVGRYIVVLGARMTPTGNPPHILRQRLDRAARLAHHSPLSRVIVTGGNSWWLPVPESTFMHVELMKRGVNPLRVIDEPTATSTVENARRSVAILRSLHASGAVIVTNGFHMKRALKNFRDESRRTGSRLTFVAGYAG